MNKLESISQGAITVLFNSIKRQLEAKKDKPTTYNLTIYFYSVKIPFAKSVQYGQIFEDFIKEAIDNKATNVEIEQSHSDTKWKIELDYEFSEDSPATSQKKKRMIDEMND